MRRTIGLAVVLSAIGLGVWQISEQQRQAVSAPLEFPSRDEIWRQTMARFDGDGDGQLSQEEFLRYQTPSLRFHDFDLSGDGYISVDELDAQIMRREPRPLMDLKTSQDAHPMLVPDRPVDDRPGRVP